MSRPVGTNFWKPIPADRLWEWYWDDLLTLKEIARRWTRHGRRVRAATDRSHPTAPWVRRQLEMHGIPQRSRSDSARLWQSAKIKRPSVYASDHAHRSIYEEFHGVALGEKDVVHHRDHVEDNHHPLNLERLDPSEPTRTPVKTRVRRNGPSRPSRPPIFEIYMRMAESVSLMSHHPRTRVGCVVASFDLRRVLAIGFNGNARGLANAPDNREPGRSGMIHAEENALIYAGEQGTDRVMFVTRSPCLHCTKLLINAGIRYLYYRERYRDAHPLKIARYSGVMLCRYDRWREEKW